MYINIFLQTAPNQPQSFAYMGKDNKLVFKARAGLGSATWEKLFPAGPASQPSCQHVLCTGLLGPVLKSELSRATVSDHAQGEKVLMYLQS